MLIQKDAKPAHQCKSLAGRLRALLIQKDAKLVGDIDYNVLV